jgi:hypothetical protein
LGCGYRCAVIFIFLGSLKVPKSLGMVKAQTSLGTTWLPDQDKTTSSITVSTSKHE